MTRMDRSNLGVTTNTLGLICFILSCIVSGIKGGESPLEGMHTDQLCIGEVVNASCHGDKRIHLLAVYFAYVHNVHAAGANCHIHYDASTQCFRKVSHYDRPYYLELLESCHNRTSCDGKLMARVGDPDKCWDYPHSPTDYMTLHYRCETDPPAIKMSPTLAAILAPHGSTQPYWPTTNKPPGSTKPPASKRPNGRTGAVTRPPGSTRPTDWTFVIGRMHPTDLARLADNTRPTGSTRMTGSTAQFAGKTLSLLWSTSRPHVYSTTTWYKTTPPQTRHRTTIETTNNPIGANVQAELQDKSHLLMVIAVSISVFVMIASIIAIAASVAFRTPKKKTIGRRRLSENSSVYYSNGDNHSTGGSTLRGSINGISNPGFQVMDKPPLDIGYADHVIIDASKLEHKELDLPDIHITPCVTSGKIANGTLATDNVYANEPLSEQVYKEINEKEKTVSR